MIFEKIIERYWLKGGHYRRCFGSTDGAAVLQDLSEFCRANESTFDADPRKHAVLEGRREVWLRIQEYLHLTPKQLAELKTVTLENNRKREQDG